MKSMTGFSALDGTVAGPGTGIGWRWELRSVNARGLDLKIRVPAGFEALDAALRPVARASLTRGSVTAALTLLSDRETERARPDRETIRAAIDVLREVRETAADAGVPLAPVTGETLVPALVAAASGVRVPRPDAKTLADGLSDGFAAALSLLVEARAEEGARLMRVIDAQVTRIDSLVRDAENHADAAVHALRERTRRQIRDLMDGEAMPEPGRLEQEVALHAARADVREEVDRLKAHVAAARDLLASDAPVGRRFDFLTQEFNREANTLCAKSATEAMTRIGLDLKTVIDQLREQAANVE